MKKVAILFILAIAALFVAGCYQTQTAPAIDEEKPATSSNEANTVLIENYEFNPKTTTIKVGETVTWLNKDSALHSIVSENYFSSAAFGQGETFTYKFGQAGTYDYICGIHTSMKGKVVVN